MDEEDERKKKEEQMLEKMTPEEREKFKASPSYREFHRKIYYINFR